MDHACFTCSVCVIEKCFSKSFLDFSVCVCAVHEGKRREKETRDLKVIYNSPHVGHDKKRRKLRWDYPYRGRVFDEEQKGEGNTQGIQHGFMGKRIIMIATTDL